MTDDFNLNKSRCILCYRKYDITADFTNIKSTIVQTSKKSLKDILTHLSKCIKTKVTLPDNAHVCGPCYEKLAEYDEIMLQLIIHQKQLSNLLETSMEMSKQEEVESINSNKGFSDDNEYVFSSDDNGKFSQTISPDSSTIPSAVSFYCSICDINLKSEASLRTHLDGHAKTFQCHICGVERRNQEYLELHMNVHEGKSEYECRYCPKRYSCRGHVVRHMALHWDKKQFQCEKCGLRFSQSYLLYNHKMKHDAEEKPLVCHQCGQSFKTIKTFKGHQLTHMADRPMYPCEECGKKFAEKYTLKVHSKMHRNGDEDGQGLLNKKNSKRKPIQREFSCIICNGVFGAKDILTEHMSAEHDVVGPIFI